MRLLFIMCFFVLPLSAHAIILSSNDTGVKRNATTNNTIYGKRVLSSTPNVDVNVEVPAAQPGQTKVVTATASESEIAKQFILGLTTPVLKTKIPNTVSPNTTQKCQNYDPANSAGLTSGIPLMGKVFLCNHASKTGYYNMVFNQALNSYTVPTQEATGDATVPSTAYSVPGKAYAGYNNLVDSTVNQGNAFAVGSGVQNGGTLDYVATRLIPIISKEFDYMTVKLPNYATDWANQVANAQQQFQSELNTLLASLGISVTSPLPANFGVTVDAALAGQYTQAQTNAQAANNAATNGQTAGAGAGTARAAAGNNTAASVLAALGNITVPAAQQPLLDSVLADLSTSITQLATYNSKNALYVAQNKVYTNNLNAYRAEKAKVAAPALYKVSRKQCGGSGRIYYAPGTPLYILAEATDISGQMKCKKTYVNQYFLPASKKIKCPAGYVSLVKASYAKALAMGYYPRTFSASSYKGAGTTILPVTKNGLRTIVGKSHGNECYMTPYFLSAAKPGPNPNLLARYKQAYQAAASKMATYKKQRDVALRASGQALATAKTNLGTLQIALANIANTAPSLVDQYTQAAQGNLNNAGNGGSAAAGLAALDSLLQGLGGMINMANGVTNALVNNVAKADIDNAATVLVKAFKASKGVSGTLALGDGIATDQEITTFLSNATATTGVQAGVGSGVAAPANSTSTHIRLNGLRDTPYRTLKEVKVAIGTLRTAMTMIAVATQSAGMTLQSYAPAPDVLPVEIKSKDASGIDITGNLKDLGTKIRNALNI